LNAAATQAAAVNPRQSPNFAISTVFPQASRMAAIIPRRPSASAGGG
jgi:hypothetical protein